MIVVTAFWHRSSVTGVAFRPQAIDEAANGPGGPVEALSGIYLGASTLKGSKTLVR
jgi:hypothetical protein